MADAVAAFPHAAQGSPYTPSGFQRKLASTTPPHTARWVLIGFGLLLVGIVAFVVSPTAGIIFLGLPVLPWIVIFPLQALTLLMASIPFEWIGSLGPPGSTTITKLLAVAIMAGWVVHLLIHKQRVRIGSAGLLLVSYVAFGALSCV
ncbi:MAG: hypothetical protein H6Q34_549, partial [Deltaproteobacteria bacterium]|nr:hypothetical protein [Deltaproteobacteria bacterium]